MECTERSLNNQTTRFCVNAAQDVPFASKLQYYDVATYDLNMIHTTDHGHYTHERSPPARQGRKVHNDVISLLIHGQTSMPCLHVSIASIITSDAHSVTLRHTSSTENELTDYGMGSSECILLMDCEQQTPFLC